MRIGNILCKSCKHSILKHIVTIDVRNHMLGYNVSNILYCNECERRNKCKAKDTIDLSELFEVDD